MTSRTKLALHLAPVVIAMVVIDRTLGAPGRLGLLVLAAVTIGSLAVDVGLRWRDIDLSPARRLLSPEVGASIYLVPMWIALGAIAAALLLRAVSI